MAIFELGTLVPGFNGVVNTGISRAGMGHVAVVYQHSDLSSLCIIVLPNANLPDLVENLGIENFAVGDTGSYKTSSCILNAGLYGIVEAHVARATGCQSDRHRPTLDQYGSDLCCH